MIAIRPARPENAAAITAIYAPHVLAGVASFEVEVPNSRMIRTRMAALDGEAGVTRRNGGEKMNGA